MGTEDSDKEKKEEEVKEEEEENDEDEDEGGGVWFWIILFGIIILVIAYFFSKGAIPGITGNVVSGAGVVKIGVLAPLSGDAATYGLSVQKGVDLAKRDLGLDNVELIYEDSRCEGKEAVTAVNKLISVDGVRAIIGELCSGATLAIAPIVENAGVVLISPASTSPEITNAGDYIFRTVPSDALQGAFAADLVFDKGYEELAILYSNEDYGLGFSNVLKDKFEGEIVANEAFERGSSDLRAQITKIKNSGADSIFIISNSPDSAVAALRQIKQLGIKVQVFGSEGLRSEDIVEGAGAAAEGLILTSVSTGEFNFFRSHRNEYGESPGPFAPQGYDALQAIAMALENGARSSNQIREELYELSFDGVSGMIDFDSKGDVEGNYEVYVVKAGIFAPIVVYEDKMESAGESMEDSNNFEIVITDVGLSS